MPMKLDWKRERRWLASFGLALAAAGVVRYSTQGELSRFTEILLIAGGVFFLAGVVLSFRDIADIFRRQVLPSWRQHAHHHSLGARGPRFGQLPGLSP